MDQWLEVPLLVNFAVKLALAPDKTGSLKTNGLTAFALAARVYTGAV